MSELTTRAKELAAKIMAVQCDCDSVICECCISDFEQALLAERKSVWEEAALLANAMSADWWSAYKGLPVKNPELIGTPERASQHTEGMSDGGEYIARVIRARAAAEKEVGK